MAIKKIVEKVVTTSLETIAVDVPGRPDLLWVYSRKPKSRKKNFKKFLMERSKYEAAKTPEDLVEYFPMHDGSVMHVQLVTTEHLELMKTGERIPYYGSEVTFGQELDGEWRIIFSQLPLRTRSIFTNPDGSPIYMNLVLHFNSHYFDIEKFYEEQKDNPELIFIPSPKGEIINPRWEDVSVVHVSFFLNEEQHKVLQTLDRDPNTLLAFLERSTIVGKYRIKEDDAVQKSFRKKKDD